MSRPELSIILPVYNGEATIEAALDSVMQQDYSDMELIVMDGKSKDRTIEMVRNIQDERLRLYSEADNGVYNAMNKGVSRARGKRIYFLGADDRMICDLNEVLPKLCKSNTIYYGNVMMDGSIYDGPFSWEKLLQKNICHQAIFFPGELFKKQQFDTQYPIYADYAFNLKNWYHPRYRWEHLPVTIAEFKTGGLSSTQNDPDFFRDLPALKNRYIHSRKGIRGKVRAFFGR